MVKVGLLVLTNSVKISKLFLSINKYVLHTLYIQYFPESTVHVPNTLLQSSKRIQYFQIIENIYAEASIYFNCKDVRVILSNLKNEHKTIQTKRPIELIIFDHVYSNTDGISFMQNYVINKSTDCKFIIIDEKNSDDQNVKISNDNFKEDKIYKNVVLGGTFDRLHNGHKIFLSKAIFYCSEKLTVGVTDTNMLRKKILWELIEPCDKRITKLRNFVEDVDPYINYNVIPINDIYGPTKEDPSFEMIVVSEETKKGGVMVNKKRIENNLNQLDIYIVNLIKNKNQEAHEEEKISSSNHRIRLLGTRLKSPNINDKPLKPYIIGLTGGIASGKSSIADKLEKLGAGLINCDTVAHSLYLPGMECYNLIIKIFGPILKSNGHIDRTALGKIVFKDKNKLEKLNKLMWPLILEETLKRVKELYNIGFEVIVIEAAVLIQAGWQPFCHEIWTCIVPQEEAIRRLMERNKLSESEAKERILVQPSNVEQVKNAHVVVSTIWNHTITQQQVQKAWNTIKKDLEKC